MDYLLKRATLPAAMDHSVAIRTDYCKIGKRCFLGGFKLSQGSTVMDFGITLPESAINLCEVEAATRDLTNQTTIAQRSRLLQLGESQAALPVTMPGESLNELSL
jgi:hypothetical protein